MRARPGTTDDTIARPACSRPDAIVCPRDHERRREPSWWNFGQIKADAPYCDSRAHVLGERRPRVGELPLQDALTKRIDAFDIVPNIASPTSPPGCDCEREERGVADSLASVTGPEVICVDEDCGPLGIRTAWRVGRRRTRVTRRRLSAAQPSQAAPRDPFGASALGGALPRSRVTSRRFAHSRRRRRAHPHRGATPDDILHVIGRPQQATYYICRPIPAGATENDVDRSGENFGDDVLR